MKYLTLLTASALLALGCGSAPSTMFGDGGPGSASGAGGDSASGGGGDVSSPTATAPGTSSVTGAGGSGGATSTGEGGAGGAVGSASTTSTSTSTTTTPVNLSGCSDGSREYFVSATNLGKGIAGCAGGFQVAGTKTAASVTPQCGRVAGDDSDNADGEGCSVEDLCAEGWHVCRGSAEVAAKAGGCEDLAGDAPRQFWLTRQGQGPVGNGIRCTDDGIDNVVGCGNWGDTPGASCNPLNRYVRDYVCKSYGSVWECDKNKYGADDDEAYSIIKPKPEQGGVLCCED